MSRISSTRRNTLIAASVVLFHLAALWALQTGLLRRAIEVIVSVDMVNEFIEPATARSDPPAPVPPAKTTPPPVPQEVVQPPPASTVPLEAANAVQTPAPSVVVPAAEPVAPAAPAAPTRVELPSSNAQYLKNPKPAYPTFSKRLGEQGKVVVRVLIGADGNAQKAEIHQSSGYSRLDQAALKTVLTWRYVPGKRGGVPETMSFLVPIDFILE